MAVRDSEASPAHETQPGAVAVGAAKPQGAPGPTRRGRGWFTTVCAVVALAAGALGLFWDVFPGYRPDPLDTIGAAIEVAAIEPRVSLREFLSRAHPDDLTRAAHAVFGRTRRSPS